MFDSVVRILFDVRYVLGFRRNLISLGTLDDVGYTYKSRNGRIFICKGSLVVIKEVKKFGIYSLIGETNFEPVDLVSKHHDSMLWHKRIGEISEKDL